MKKILLYTTAMLALTFGSCQQESDPIFKGGGSDSFSLKVEIDNIGTGMQTDTRAIIVDPVAGEEKVAGLHLLFFDASSDGSGKFKHSVQINNGNEITTGSNFAVNFEGANSGNYSILAFANAEEYFLNTSGGSLQEFLNDLDENMTETDVINNTLLYTGNSISIDKLIMSGYTDKTEGVQLVTLKLTRGVVRFDIQNLDSDYNLVSAAVYNKASYTPLWLSTSNASIKPPVTAGKFYDVAPASGAQSIRGGLYTLENYVSNPKTGDNSTTAIVVGLEKGGIMHFYRVNINPEESGQSLKRNYVYQLTVRKVLGDGEISSDDAASTSTDPNLDYDINNWNLDDEGLIVTDGKNTLAIPSKIIRFAQEGGERSYTIFTDGEGTLAMTQSLPNGLSASLSGNTLTVTAQDLGTLSRRDGTLKISFAGLQGEVQVIQEPKIAHFLRLDQTSLRGFSATASAATAQTIIVNSSADWTAKVYNTGGSHFVIDGNDTGQSGEELKITVDANNETNKVLTGFVLVSLKDIPGYSRVVMLKQSTLGGISIDLGSLTALDFKVNGAPKAIPDATSGDVYEFTVDPGEDDNGNSNTWNAKLLGTNADKFKLLVEKENGVNRVTVYPWNESATGNLRYFNLTPGQITGVELKVYSGDDDSVTDPRLATVVPISQDALVFNAIGTIISVKGGTGIAQIQLSDGLTWSAEIKENQTYDDANTTLKNKYAGINPKGYLLDVNSSKLESVGDKVTGQTGTSLIGGFNKLMYPVVNMNPTITVEVSVDQIAGVTKTIEIKQEDLVPRSVNVLDLVGGRYSYGSLNANRGDYMQYFIKYLEEGFGLFSSTNIKCFVNFHKKPMGSENSVDSYDMTLDTSLPISSNYNYINAGHTKDQYRTEYNWSQVRFDELDKWRKENEGVIYITQDVSSTYTYNAAPFFEKLKQSMGYEDVTSSTSNGLFEAKSSNNRILNYIYSDGPFGELTLDDIRSTIGRVDGAHSAISRASVEVTGTVILTEENNSNGAMLFIDPDKQIVYNGEVRFFDDSDFSVNYIDGSSTAARKTYSRFLGNFLSYIVRAAQYGSHFTDIFKKSSTDIYPFDKLKDIYPEPMFE